MPPNAAPRDVINAISGPPFGSVSVQGVGEPTVIPRASDTGEVEGITVAAPRGPAFTEADRNLLARMVFTEGANSWETPGLFEALGSAAINRVGDPEYKGHESLQGVINARKQFQGVNTPAPDSLWQKSADPTTLTGTNAQAYARALQVADGLLSGQIRDNTGGATSFFSSADGMPVGDFRHSMSSQIGTGGQLIPPRLKRSRMDIGPFTFLRRP